MSALLAIATIAVLPVALVVLTLAVLAGLLGSLVERDLGVGLFADRDARSLISLRPAPPARGRARRRR